MKLKWTKITRRTKPPEGEAVWLWDGERMWIGAYEYCIDDPGGWFYGMGHGLYWDGTQNVLDCNEWDDDYSPTHFMLLPSAPVETTDQSVKRSEGDEPEARA